MDVSISSLQNLQSVDEIQRVIEKLQAARDRLVKEEQQETVTGVPANSTSEEPLEEDQSPDDPAGDTTFECLNDELIDVSNLEDEDISQWLVKTGDDSVNIAELEADRSYMDLSMLNVQNSLLNLIKGFMFERTEKAMFKSPKPCPQVNNVASPTPKKLYNMSPPTPLRRVDSYSSDSSNQGMPVLASSPIPTKQNKFEMLDTFESNINHSNFIGTPQRSIDTRTYTRPKKTRMSLDGHLQGSGEFSTLTLKKNSSSLSLQRQEIYPNKNNNLNETFVQDDIVNSTFTKADESALSNTLTVTSYNTSTTSPRSQQVKRNDSYSVSKSPRSNSNNTVGQDLNSTFVCNADIEIPNDSGHNLSMEELHVMARLQEQSLKNASPARTLTRKETHVVMTFNNFDVNHRPPQSRTSSTDTYSLGQSNPDSPGSSASGLSSPLDAPSYDNLQGDAFRRSMPDLAISRRLSATAGTGRTLSLVPPMNLLKSKPYHTSDTRLMRAGMHGSNSRLGMHTNGFGYNKNKRNQSPDRSSSSSVETNNLMTHGRTAQSSIEPSARTGRAYPGAISQPRGAGIAKPVTRPPSFLPTPGFSQSAGGIRPQSRIPAPGAGRGMRFSRPNTAGSRPLSTNKQPEWRDGCY